VLFNSYLYLLVFLPFAVISYRLIDRSRARWAAGWLAVVSLLYYCSWHADPSGAWRPWPLMLMCCSVLFNFSAGRALLALRETRWCRPLLWLGVGVNLSVLFWFKYSLFFARIAQDVGMSFESLPDVILPLGISFVTFQKIAFLVDVSEGKVSRFSFKDFALFVLFFPQLIAGPIVHHAEMMPQFRVRRRAGWIDFSVGLTILVIGLFKKVVIADMLARDASLFFNLAASGHRELTFAEGWCAAFLYALQLYFDFSGYSDMAIGSARLFGIRLPENFFSPYKAVSIVDFWRRWHITLSRFLRDYLYIKLGGNRHGAARRYMNLFVTMLLGGLWHGAGFAFVLWGALHGLLLSLNHAWFAFRKRTGLRALPRPAAIALTLVVVVTLWVPFRAGTIEFTNPAGALKAVKNIWGAMYGFHGFDAWPSVGERIAGLDKVLRFIPVLIGVLLIPNTQQFMGRYRPVFAFNIQEGRITGPRRWWQWRPNLVWLGFTLLLLLFIGLEFNKVSEFIYFQF
jgi:D-alanyl-lipoteichoic acid acyltransferase DltB (MBOAT superfamily)